MGDIDNFTNTHKFWSEMVSRSIKNIDRQSNINMSVQWVFFA